MAAAEDLGDGMHCSDHPYRSNPGAICALCLQEKLGKLLSSSTSISTSSSLFPPLPSSSTSTSSSLFPPPPPPPLAAFLKRSNSVAPRPTASSSSSSAAAAASVDTPRKKSFWSFHRRSGDSTSKKTTTEPDNKSVTGSSLGRKVARSRSVGCGSRSFSGDFLERISTGFGDCTLRRVESQRETDSTKVTMQNTRDHRVKERVKCGGIFGGFGMISSSNYWLSAAATAATDDFSTTRTRISSNARRHRSWGWAFASPMRAFRPVSSSSKNLGSTLIKTR